MYRLTLSLLTAILLLGCAAQPTTPIEEKPTEEKITSNPIIDKKNHFTQHKATYTAFSNALATAFSNLDQSLFKASLASSTLFSHIPYVMSENSAWKFLRMTPSTSNPMHANSLVRVEYDNYDIDYLNFVLTIENDKIHIIDWYSHSLGWSAATILAHYKKLNEKLTQRETTSLDMFMSTFQTRHYTETVNAYDNLPKSIKTAELILLIYKAAAKKTNIPAYQQALKTLHQYHGSNDQLSFLFIDYHLYSGDFKGAHAALDSFAMRVQWDAPLFTLKASIAYYEQQYFTAIKYCRQAINNNKDYEQAYFLLLDNLVFNALYEDAILVLTILEQRFSYDFEPDTLAQIAGYIDFVNSKQFSTWATAAY